MEEKRWRGSEGVWVGRVTPLRFGWQSEVSWGGLTVLDRHWHWSERAAIRSARKRAARHNAVDARQARGRYV